MDFKKMKKFLHLLIFITLIVVIVGCKKPVDDDYDFTDLTKRDFISENGMVAAASPYAAKAGLDILKAGGNAFDAAVAVGFALGVTEPNASGVGGGGFMVGYEASTGEFMSYDFREFVPGAGVPSAFPNRDADVDDGPKSIGVPMEVDGLLTILENHGTLTREKVMAPAIKYAKEGVLVTPELASAISNNFSKLMRMRDENVDVYTSDGITPLVAGELLVNENLGETLETIAFLGKEGFYKGRIAEALVNTVQSLGGLITQEDLDRALNSTRRITPVQGNYHGYDIISANAPTSGGITLIEMLNIIELYGNVNELEHNSTEYLHVLATAMQLAYGDKRRYVADPDFIDIPLAGLLSKNFAATRLPFYDPNNAFLGRGAAGGEWGDAWSFMPASPSMFLQSADVEEHYSTTHFVVADKDGNVVSITKTINYFFGSGVVVRGTGIHLNNQLSGFSFTPSNVAYIQPYKKPMSHVTPTIIMKDGEPFAAIGSPGSMRIPAAVCQVILNIIDFDMNIQEAIEACRIYNYAMSSAEESAGLKTIYIERGLGSGVVEGLTQLGYDVILQGSGDIDLYFGGVQGIIFRDGKLHGGADTRRDGKALGY